MQNDRQGKGRYPETRARVRTAPIHARHRETHNIRFGQRKVDIAYLQADPAFHGNDAIVAAATA
jgi:hypothetical protein